MMMTGKTVLVTGSNSGIGKETALGLARLGANLVMAVRDREAGEKARAEIIEKTGNQDIDLLVADLSSMAEVRALASEFKEKHDRLHVLVNNAGAIFPKRRVTVDGFEMTLAVDYLAPVLLTHDLLDVLARSAPSRIVNVSSGAHTFGRIDFNNLQSTKYGSMRAYGSAKLMNIMFIYALSRRLEGSGITANVLHPGLVRTNFGHNDAGLARRGAFKILGVFSKSPAQGAETSIYLASSPEVEDVNGVYFADSKPKESSKISHDIDVQEKLWRVTLEMLGIEEGDFDATKTHSTEARQDLS
jgi:retinol dehydrogenase-14